jgi:hypothetical protein
MGETQRGFWFFAAVILIVLDIITGIARDVRICG